MIVSHRLKLVFVHVPKTGGSTITRLLAPYVDSVAPDRLRDQGLGWQGTHHAGRQHAAIADRAPYVRHLKKRGYLVAGFVRNPWERAASLWRSWPFSDRAAGRTLADALEILLADPIAGKSAAAFLAWPDGELAADFVGRFETFEPDVRRLFAAVNAHLPATLPRILDRGPLGDWRALFTDPARARIAAAWGQDIERWGYEF